MKLQLNQSLSKNSQLSLLIFLSGIAFWLVIGQSLYDGWKEKADQTLYQETILVKQLKILANADQIEQNYSKIPTNLKAQGSDEQEIAQLQNEMTALARQTGVTVDKTKSLPLEEFQTHKLALLELDCQGTMLQIADFIYRMQKSSDILKVVQLRLTPKTAQSSLLHANLLIRKILIKD